MQEAREKEEEEEEGGEVQRLHVKLASFRFFPYLDGFDLGNFGQQVDSDLHISQQLEWNKAADSPSPSIFRLATEMALTLKEWINDHQS